MNRSVPVDLTIINDSDDVCGLNKILSWCVDLTDAASSKVSTIALLDYEPSIHTAQTPYPVHPLHSYPPLTTPQKQLLMGHQVNLHHHHVTPQHKA